MTQPDRALPRRTATPEAETSPSALGLFGAPDLYVSTDADLADHTGRPSGRARRAGAFRTVLTLTFVAGAVGAGFAAGGGLGQPTAQPYDTIRPEVAAPIIAPASLVDTTVSTAGGHEDDSIVDDMFGLRSSRHGADDDAASSTTSSTAPSTTSTAAPVTTSTAAKPKAVAAVATTAPAKPATTSTTAKPVATVPPTTAAPTTTAAPPPPIGGNDAATLACIRARESGGNYAIVSSNGLYYGAYQFTLSTWDGTARHAGRGDLVGKKPNLVAPADQDAMALHLLHWQGLAPWGGYCA